MTDKDGIEEKLRALRESYAAQLPAKLDAVDALWKPLGGDEWDADSAQELHRAVHSLAGSGSTFGYTRLSEQARGIEQVLKGWLQEDKAPDSGARAQMQDNLHQLRRVINDSSERTPVEITGSTTGYEGADKAQRLLYLVEDDAAIVNELTLQLENFDYQVRGFSNTEALIAAVVKEHPDAIIMDVVLREGGLAGLEAIGGLKEKHNSGLPVIFISSRDDLQSRLDAVRAGGDAYFTKPVDFDALIGRLDQLTDAQQPEPYRVLIVDDDATLAAHYGLVLGQAGMDTSTVTQPLDIMEALANEVPELILMDVYMPECSGLELAKLIRQQDSYLSVPIVFLSGESDLEKQFGALRMGGDDFLTKPIADDHLVSSVAIRAERSRLINSLMVRDSLTGLLKHTRIKEQLEVEVSRARRAHAHFSFVMVDIDHFKSVNDTYGHMSGDRVIKSLSRLLQQRLRQSDSIGRYGGEEFAAILPDCAPEHAVRILDEIRTRFADIAHLHNGRDFSVTFSAGVAGFPAHKSAADLNQAADEALYEAKRQGRNCVVVAAAG